jgi:hypothetical protein
LASDEDRSADCCKPSVLMVRTGLISRKRGGPSNRAVGLVFRETVLAIVRERDSDFGPTLAAEKLSERHGLDLGVETLRQWMIGASSPDQRDRRWQ